MISLIVPAYNAERTITRCLKSLENQKFPKDQYEIIVVDDGSRDRTASLAKRSSRVRYFRKSNAGPASARNFGAKQANGDILLFIDADCEADHYWIAEMAKPFAEKTVSAVKGSYQTKQKGLTARLIQLEFQERYAKMEKARNLDFMDFSAGGIRKEVFDALGGFDESLKMSEDVKLAYSLSNKGYKIVFTRKAIVFHEHPVSFKRYLRLKFWRSYWRMDVYKNYPQKILKDSYTPQTLKLQILLIFAALTLLFLLLLIPFIRYLFYFAVGFLIVLLLPLTLRAFRQGFTEGLLMPFFCLGRALALGFGVLYYFLGIKNIRELFIFILIALILVVPSFFTGGMDIMARGFAFILSFLVVFLILRSGKAPLSGKIPLKYNVILPLFIFFGVMLLSVFVSISPYESYLSFLQWLLGALIFLGVFYFINSVSEGHKFAYLFIFLGVVLSLVGLYFFIQTQFYQYLRAVSTFYQHNPFAGFLFFPLALTFSYLFFTRNRKKIIVLTAIALLLSLTFVLTHSRGAWLSFAVPFILILFFATRQRKKWMPTFCLVAAIAVIVGLAFWGLTEIKNKQAQSTASESGEQVSVGYSVETPEENAVTARLNFWEGAKNIFLDHPILGTGFDTYRISYRQYIKDIRFYSIDPHNIYLKVPAEMGVVGAIPFFWLTAVILITVVAGLKYIKKLENNPDKALVLGLSAGLIAALFHNFVELDWQFPSNLILFFMALAIYYKIFLLERNKIQAPDASSQNKLLYSKPAQITIGLTAFIIFIGGCLIFFSSTLEQNGDRYLEEGKSQEAEVSFATASSLDPLNYKLHEKLAYTYAQLSQSEPEYSRLYPLELEKSIDLSKENYSAYELLGRYYLLANDFQEAEKLLQQAIAFNPVNKPALYSALTDLYLKQEKYREIIDLLEKALPRYNPSLADSVIWQQPDKQKILNQISELHNSLGVAYQITGHSAQANDSFLKALEYNPENEAARKNREKTENN